ncbi:MAG TPA: iron ABC transporter permease [Candidatus Acidoferrales bacterium]|nr:iron ABC transporter permease [Candidatus Acidoferrales bacterium]
MPASTKTAAFTPSRVFGLWSQVRSNLFLVLVTAFLLLLILVPLVRLILSSFQLGHPAMPEGWTLQNYIAAYALPTFYRALGTTVVLSAVSTLITLAIAILFAWLVERTDMPFRNLAWTLILIPMAIPGVLFALGWALLLSPKTGTMNIVLRAALELFGVRLSEGPLNIYSLGGLIFLDGLRGVTTIFLMIVGAFRMMDPSLEEAARVSRASPAGTFFQVTLPVLLPAVLTAGMYEFVSSMESFEAPLAVGLPAGIFVLSTLIYFTVRLQAPVDYGLGSVFGVTYMVLLLFLLWAYRRAVRYGERYTTVTGKGYRPRVIALGKWRYPALGMFLIYFVLTVLAPFAILFWASLLPSYRPPSLEALGVVSLRNYWEIFSRPHFLAVVGNTLVLMAIAASATMLLAFFVSWIVVRTKVRGRALLDSLLFLPHSIPGIVVALAMIMAYLTPPLSYLKIYGTLWIVTMGLIVTYIAFGTRLMNSSIIQIQKELEEAAYVCGATSTKTLLAITLPLLFPAFAAGWIWVAVHALRAFSIPLMLASKRNEVFSVLMWQYWSDGDVALASTLGVLLMITLIPLTLLMRRFIVQVSGQQS